MTPPWLEQLRAVTPRWFDGALWAATHVDDMAFALLSGAWASLRHPEQPIYTFLPRLLADPHGCGRRVRVLPRDGRYVVASDHHLLYATAPHDYFGGYGRGEPFRNEAMYAAVMAHYGRAGYTLIENGDVEDLVVTEPQHDRTSCLLTGVVGRVVYLRDDALRRTMRLHRLWRIVRTYAGYYTHLQAQFPGRIVKLVGNHDVELLQGSFAAVVPLQVPIDEYAVIPAGDDGPAVIVCHGHQMDPWTCEQTARGVGESITESFAWLGQGADRIWRRTDWSDPVSHDNVAVPAPSFAPGRTFPPKVRHMGERRLVRELGRVFDRRVRPWLVLGHTHEPRMLPAERYVNGGAVGRYQDLLWLVEIERGVPQLVAWWARQDGDEVRLVRAAMSPDAAGTRLVAGGVTEHGAVPPLPYAPRRPLAEVDAGIPVALPPVPVRWLVWRTAVHALGYGLVLGLLGWLVGRCAG